MSERAAPRWVTRDWRGHPNYVCTVGGCLFATLDIGEMRRHARDKHPLASEGGQPHPLAGLEFASPDAARAARDAGLDARSFDGITPSGRTGGFTVADVRSAARTVNPES